MMVRVPSSETERGGTRDAGTIPTASSGIPRAGGSPADQAGPAARGDDGRDHRDRQEAADLARLVGLSIRCRPAKSLLAG